jgi:hypothetical protein
MRYYRCKCGEQTAWGSMPVSSCQGCKKCNTTLEEFPMDHKIPEPHEYITKFDENTGKPYEVCRVCWERK